MSALEKLMERQANGETLTSLEFAVFWCTDRVCAEKAAEELERVNTIAEERGLKVKTLSILFAWEAGQLTEWQASKLLGVDRLEARNIRLNKINAFAWSEEK